MLNKFGPSGHGEAQVQYLDGDFRVISPGTYVRCAITDVRIPLDELKYWSVDLQEAYSVPSAVLQRHFGWTIGVPAYASHFSFLEHAQEFGLQLRIHLGNFIEEEGSSVRLFKTSQPLFEGMSKGAFFMAENFALHQGRRNRGTV